MIDLRKDKYIAPIYWLTILYGIIFIHEIYLFISGELPTNQSGEIFYSIGALTVLYLGPPFLAKYRNNILPKDEYFSDFKESATRFGAIIFAYAGIFLFPLIYLKLLKECGII